MLNRSFLLKKKQYKIIMLLIWSCLFISLFAHAGSVSEFDKVLDSLIDKDYQRVKEIFNSASQSYDIHSQGNLGALLCEPFFLDEEISGNVFTKQEELDYIRNTVIVKRLVKRLTKGLQTDREIIFALYDWTVRNIAILQENDIGADINGFVYDYMMRGFGRCDRSAWVLATLAFQVGYHANIISMSAQHSITQIYLEDTWALFDPHNGIVFKDDKKLLSIDDKATIATIKASRCYDGYSVDDFMSSNVVTICEPLSILPKMEILQDVLNKNCEDAPRVYYDILGELSFCVSTMSHSSSKLELPITIPYFVLGKKYKIGLWLFPFEKRVFNEKGVYVKKMEKHYPYLKYYTKAREYQIMGDFEKALIEYEKLFAKNLDSSVKESLVYNRALCYYEMKENSTAKKIFLSYKKIYPQGKEIKGVDYHLELLNCKESINDLTEDLYSKGKSHVPSYHYRFKGSIIIKTDDSYFQANRFTGFWYRAVDYFNSDQLDKSIDALENAATIKPKDENVSYFLGQLYKKKQ